MSKVTEPRKGRIFYCLGGVHKQVWSKNDVQDELEGEGRCLSDPGSEGVHLGYI